MNLASERTPLDSFNFIQIFDFPYSRITRYLLIDSSFGIPFIVEKGSTRTSSYDHLFVRIHCREILGVSMCVICHYIVRNLNIIRKHTTTTDARFSNNIVVISVIQRLLNVWYVSLSQTNTSSSSPRVRLHEGNAPS